MAIDITDVWTTILIRETSNSTLPQWAREAMAKGYARSIIVSAWLKLDRENSAKVAYA